MDEIAKSISAAIETLVWQGDSQNAGGDIEPYFKWFVSALSIGWELYKRSKPCFGHCFFDDRNR